MAIRPDGLDGVAAHAGKLHQFKRIARVGLFRGFVEVAQNIHLPLATGAGAGPAQGFERNKIFRAVRPLYRQFISDGLNIQWSHGCSVNLSARPSTVSNFFDSPQSAVNLFFVEN